MLSIYQPQCVPPAHCHCLGLSGTDQANQEEELNLLIRHFQSVEQNTVALQVLSFDN